MNILALEPYYGGSHQAFLDGWRNHSRHDWTTLGLPPNKWKWRMRHADITYAQDVAERLSNGEQWDVVLCSDMLNLASFRGLAPKVVRDLPTIAYFHENQLTYPVRYERRKDDYFVFVNLTTALAADQVWWNSAYNRDAFLESMEGILRKMPDYQSLDSLDAIRAKSHIMPPGIDPWPAPASKPSDQPIHILWAARWEFDKNPETFFEALHLLRKTGTPFRLSVLGEEFASSPPVFEQAREDFADQIVHWGYQESNDDYRQVLSEADVIVSTARHEFFGLSVVEAVAAGAYPVVPKRLAYPEVLDLDANPDFFFRGGAPKLAQRLETLTKRHQTNGLWGNDHQRGHDQVTQYFWQTCAATMDATIESSTKE